jgi:hypothetical protein
MASEPDRMTRVSREGTGIEIPPLDDHRAIMVHSYYKINSNLRKWSLDDRFGHGFTL